MTQEKITSGTITRGLFGYFRMRYASSIFLPNIHVGTSPWECDAIRVTRQLYWIEYEIKLTLSDYKADFIKRRMKWIPDSLRKHEAYQSDDSITVSSRVGRLRIIPKPKQFYFVVPRGLLDNVDVPKHCGVMEFDSTTHYGWGISVKRRAPNLKNPTQLDSAIVFNLAMKASHRFAAALIRNRN